MICQISRDLCWPVRAESSRGATATHDTRAIRPPPMCNSIIALQKSSPCYSAYSRAIRYGARENGISAYSTCAMARGIAPREQQGKSETAPTQAKLAWKRLPRHIAHSAGRGYCIHLAVDRVTSQAAHWTTRCTAARRPAANMERVTVSNSATSTEWR